MTKIICMECKEEVISSDFGHYCINQDCELWDKKILSYEQTQTVDRWE